MPNSDWIPLSYYSDEATKRTIKFSILNGFWPPAYRRCQYEQYGAIRSLRFDHLLDDGGQLICYIEFENQQVAADLLSRGYICINDNKIKISQLMGHDDSSIKTTETSVLELPPGTTSSDNILEALNDDCLREIFRKLHLSTLHTVCNVCVRFNRIAKEIFKLKYRNETIGFCDVTMDYPISLRNAENFLTNFGPSIGKLSLAKVEVALDETLLNNLLRLISKHCVNIYALEIDYVDYREPFLFEVGELSLSDKILIEVRELFCRLKHLNFMAKGGQTLNVLLSSCSQLESLTITPFEWSPTEIVLPKLRTVHLYFYSANYLPYLKCSQLKSVSVCDFSADTTLLQYIAESFPNMNTLSIRISKWNDDSIATNVLHLGKLKSLQCLRLDCNRNNAFELMEKILENNVELKCLELTNIQIDDGAAIDSISQMKSIEELTFKVQFDGRLGYNWIGGLNTNHLKRLAQRLPNLQKLSVSELEHVDIMDIIGDVVPFAKQLSVLNIRVFSNFVGLPDFDKVSIELTKIIQNREKPKKLTITIDCDCTPNEGNKILQVKHMKVVNNEWLRINIDFTRKSFPLRKEISRHFGNPASDYIRN